MILVVRLTLCVRQHKLASIVLVLIHVVAKTPVVPLPSAQLEITSHNVHVNQVSLEMPTSNVFLVSFYR